MGNFSFSVPSLGNKFVDYRDPILGDSYNWSWVRPMSQVTHLVIHHTAGPDTQTPDDIAAFHVNSRGWGGIGYHFVINPAGVVYYVGDLTTARAHVLNMNDVAVGICLIGSFINGKVPTQAQIIGARELCNHLLFHTPELTNVDGWDDVVGHQNLSATACPGDTWNSWRQQIVSQVPPPQPQPQPSPGDRAAQITQLYKDVLGRDPDQNGLNQYVNSTWSIDQIRKIMVESPEHKDILVKAKKFGVAQMRAHDAFSLSNQTSNKINEIINI